MRSILKGSTDQTFLVYAVDDLTGLPKTGLAHSSITARYVRTRGAAATITTVALAAADSAHADGGWYEIDATNCKGWYRFDGPDAAFATGADEVVVTLQATNAILSPISAELDDETTIQTSVDAITDAAIEDLLTYIMQVGKMDRGTVGEALQAMRAFAMGSWTGSGATVTLYGHDRASALTVLRLLPEAGPFDRALETGDFTLRLDGVSGLLSLTALDASDSCHAAQPPALALAFTPYSPTLVAGLHAPVATMTFTGMAQTLV